MTWPRRASHGHRLLALSGVLAASTVFAPAAITFAQAAERRVVAISDPARTVTLDVRLARGSVDILADDRRDVLIEPVRPSPGGAPVPGAPTLAVLEVQEQNNVIGVLSRTDTRIDIRILVPRRANVRLRKSGATRPPSRAGAVTIRGVEGDLEVETVAGDITLMDVSGSVVAHSRLSDVVVTLARAALDRPMAFTSYSGNVAVTLPAAVKANVILRSDRRSAVTDFDLLSDAVDPASSGATDRRVRDRSVRFKVNGGGPEFELRSYSGTVSLRKQP